jgi:enoyl-CoA hydratase/carnithine racemase
MSQSDEHVVQEVAGHVLTLQIARPEKKNALTLAMYEALTTGLEHAARSPEVRVVLVRGTDGVFTSGNDLGDFMKSPPSTMDSPVGRFLQALVEHPKPIVAAVDGAAIGVGTTMLLHCDLVYAARGTRFALPFTTLGLSPEAASTLLLPLLCGRARASELLLLGERFDDEVAREIGLVNDVLPPDALHAHAAARASALAALPPASVRLTKRLIDDGRREAVLATLRREGEVFFERLRSPEAAEAMQAFFERRAPDFSRFE